ncbi:MAG: oligosaccharide flippase family protein [Pyrinomonadaceae bacterium]
MRGVFKMAADQRDGQGRLAKNTIFSMIGWFFPLVLGFVATPVLVTGLGPEQYGILAVILGFLSYSFTFGTGKVVAKFIPEYRAAGEYGKLSEVVSATLVFSLVIGLIGSIAIAVLANYIVSNILLIPTESQDAASKAFYFASATGLALMIGQAFQYLLQGLHRFGSYVLLTNLNGVLLAAGNITLVLNGFGIVAIMAWSFFVAALIGVLFFVNARRALPELKVDFRVNKAVLREVAKYGSNIILFQIFANILYIFERAWVTRKFGPQALTYYAVPMLLAIYMHGIVASFAQAIFPRVNELLNDRVGLTRLYQRATKIVLAVVAFIGASYVIAGKVFLSLWVSAEFSTNAYDLLVIHSVTFALLAIGIMPLQIAEAFRFSRLTVVITFSWMLIGVPLMILSADVWESEGIGISRLAVVVLTFPLILYVEKRFLGQVFSQFWLAALARICLATVAFSFVGYQIFLRFPGGWLTLFVGITVCGLLYAGLLFLTGYFTRADKDMIRDLFARGRWFSSAADS